MAKTQDDQQSTEVQKSEGSGEETGPVGREFYVEMARNRNARVMLANTLETYVLSDLVRAADVAIKNVRSKLLISIPVDDFADAMGDYNASVLIFSEAISRLFGLYGGSYREPKGIKAARKNKKVQPKQVRQIFDEIMELFNRRVEEASVENAADESEAETADEPDEVEAEIERKKVKAA